MILRRKNTEPEIAFRIAGEMIPNNGEDCSFLSVGEERSLVSVFDGCGGIGSRRYENFSGKTGAYVSSRAICGAVQTWFESGQDNPMPQIDQALRIVSSYGDKGRGLRGSLRKDFPTTAVIATAQREGTYLNVDCFWAGDSRAYLLTSRGLHQLTRDDVSNSDALDNLSDDGVLTNVISASVPFELHRHRVQLAQPAIVIAATDGCFGYLKTPMHFEALLLKTMLCAQSIAEWKESLRQAIAEHAGDDYSLCLIGYGFSDFSDVKAAFDGRGEVLIRDYIAPLTNESATVDELWHSYREGYYAYCKDA